MRARGQERIGFCCAYTPLPLIHAAGFTPFRILPLGQAPDQAASLLHDNMCPHVKRILDRALADDLPELRGVVFMNSCDAMRRLADAWPAARPADPTMLVDLPVIGDEAGVAYFAGELARLVSRLSEWSGRAVTPEDVLRSSRLYRQLAEGLERLESLAAQGRLPGGRPALQEVLNRSVAAAVEDSLGEVSRLEAPPHPATQADSRVPLYLFGNVLADPQAFALFESCGASLVAEDLCTGSRQITPIEVNASDDVFIQLARGVLSRPPCPRTLEVGQPGALAERVVSAARACRARGVIAHVMKFCDPYLGRLPAVREALRAAGMPLLVLEGDCTMRSLGQHRTRIEAFVEMLGGSST